MAALRVLIKRRQWFVNSSTWCVRSSISEGCVCVHCGLPVKWLTKSYSPTVLKLVSCRNCGNIADKYLEYDEVITLIDMILLNKEAYRHVLFNTKFQNHWKVALIILITKTANEWLYVSSENSPKCSPSFCHENTVYSFFSNFLITVLGEFFYFLVICSFFILLWNGNSFLKPFNLTEVKIIWKAVISSSFGYFLLLPSIIWSGFQRDIHYLFIFVYALLSHIQALTVIYTIHRSLLAGLLVFASGTNYLVSYFLRCFFDTTIQYN